MANIAPMRLQKALSLYGICSRRKAEEMIAAGRIQVNGHPAQTGMSIHPARDIIFLDGQRIHFDTKQEKIYIMLHKPRGYVTTLSDEMDRRCVTELIEDVGSRVYPVGRLDRNSEGLLLFTNDGEFANAMMHPSSHVPKCYRVTVAGKVTEDQVSQLCAGVEIDGKMTLPAQAQVLLREKERTVLEIVLVEGRNRQIRKMCEAVGLTVSRLKRTSVGGLRLGMLAPGTWRHLTSDELRALRIQCGLTASPSGRKKDEPAVQKMAPNFGKGQRGGSGHKPSQTRRDTARGRRTDKKGGAKI